MHATRWFAFVLLVSLVAARLNERRLATSLLRVHSSVTDYWTEYSPLSFVDKTAYRDSAAEAVQDALGVADGVVECVTITPDSFGAGMIVVFTVGADLGKTGAQHIEDLKSQMSSFTEKPLLSGVIIDAQNDPATPKGLLTVRIAAGKQYDMKTLTDCTSTGRDTWLVLNDTLGGDDGWATYDAKTGVLDVSADITETTVLEEIDMRCVDDYGSDQIVVIVFSNVVGNSVLSNIPSSVYVPTQEDVMNNPLMAFGMFLVFLGALTWLLVFRMKLAKDADGNKIPLIMKIRGQNLVSDEEKAMKQAQKEIEEEDAKKKAEAAAEAEAKSKAKNAEDEKNTEEPNGGSAASSQEAEEKKPKKKKKKAADEPAPADTAPADTAPAETAPAETAPAEDAVDGDPSEENTGDVAGGKKKKSKKKQADLDQAELGSTGEAAPSKKKKKKAAEDADGGEESGAAEKKKSKRKAKKKAGDAPELAEEPGMAAIMAASKLKAKVKAKKKKKATEAGGE